MCDSVNKATLRMNEETVEANYRIRKLWLIKELGEEALFASGGSRIVSVCCFVGVGSDTLDPDSGRSW